MDKEQHKTIGAFFKKKRIQAGLSQAQVADSLGYDSNQLVSNWERGTCSPPLNKLGELVDIYALSKREVVDLMVRETKKFIEEKIHAAPKTRRLRRK